MSSCYSVLVTGLLPPSAQRRLEALADADEINLVQHKEATALAREGLLKNVKGVDGILCLITNKIDKELLDAAGPSLRVISTMSVGYDHIELKEVTARGIRVGYTPDVLTDAVAEISVALALMAARRIGKGIQLVRSGEWLNESWIPTAHLGMQMTNKTVGIVGLGRIGLAIAHRMKAFTGGTPVLYHSRSEHKEHATQLSPPGVYIPTLRDLLSSADVIFVCCSLTDETRGMFDERTFQHMRPGSVFVNTSRGAIVVTTALVKALKEKWIGSAGIDVVDPEPIGAGHVLNSLSNCVILPHIGSATLETREAMAHLAVDNLMAGLRRQSLKHSVN